MEGRGGALWRDEEGTVGTEWKGKGSGEDIDESIYNNNNVRAIRGDYLGFI